MIVSRKTKRNKGNKTPQKVRSIINVQCITEDTYTQKPEATRIYDEKVCNTIMSIWQVSMSPVMTVE